MLDTPRGPARVWGWGSGVRGRLVLGHGAGGAAYVGAGGAPYGAGGAPYASAGGAACAGGARNHGARGTGGALEPDLRAARDAGLAAGWTVRLVEQPWRLAGRRVAEAPARLDQAWVAVLDQLSDGLPTVLGGRSAGARVACRTATAAGAVGVLCLAFPLQPPRPANAPAQAPSRQAELTLPQVPVLVVQGDRDPFGVPAETPGRRVVTIRGGDHAFAVRKRDRDQGEALAEVQQAVRGWLDGLAGPVPDVRR